MSRSNLLSPAAVSASSPAWPIARPSAPAWRLLAVAALGAATLLGALERSAILTNEKFRGVRLQLAPGSLKISCSNSEQEEASEELEIAYAGESLEVGFNIQFLMDVLRSANGDDIQIAFGDANRSTLITLPNNAEFKYIVMPMRI